MNKKENFQAEAQELRKVSFHKQLPLNSKLLELISGDNDNKFLSNSPIHNVYLYLVDYMVNLASRWFKTDATQLNVLDWGCGKGQITFLLNERGVSVTSADRLDDSDDSSFGQSTPIISKTGIQVVGLEHDYLLPFADESFEIIISMGVLEHVPNELESLKEINRILKPGGLLFCFFLPYQYSWTQNLAHLRGNFYHDRLYSKQIVMDLLSASQFDLLDIWNRQLLPKNSVQYPNYHLFESMDQWLTDHTPIKHLGTNIEFTATKSSRSVEIGS